MTHGLLESALVATVLGFSLSRIGFSNWDDVHRMFTFSDLRLLLTFLCAVGILTVAFRLAAPARASRSWPTQRLRRGSILGGLLFGAGWALSGACPSIALVQLGEGQGLALFTIVGIGLGNWLCAKYQGRHPEWDEGSCVGN